MKKDGGFSVTDADVAEMSLTRGGEKSRIVLYEIFRIYDEPQRDGCGGSWSRIGLGSLFM